MTYARDLLTIKEYQGQPLIVVTALFCMLLGHGTYLVKASLVLGCAF